MLFDQDDQTTLRALLAWRRDVRRFRRDPLDAADIDALEDAVALAPSVGLSQPWRIMRVESPAARAAVIAIFDGENASAAEDYDGERQRAYRQLKLAGLREAPLQLAVFTEEEPEQGHGLGRRTMPETLAYSTVCAIHGLWLTARARNLGVGWVSILDRAAVEQTLDAEPSWRLTAYLCVGHPIEHDVRPELEKQNWEKRQSRPWERR